MATNRPVHIEFDHPFTLDADGNVQEAPEGFYAPEVYHSDTDDVEIYAGRLDRAHWIHGAVRLPRCCDAPIRG